YPQNLLPDCLPCFFVEVNGKTVGFSLTLPNFNEAIKKANGRLFPLGLLKILYYSKKIGAARTVQLGMIKEYQKTGLGAYCYVEIVRRAKKHGFHRGEMSWILSNNKPMVNAAELLGAKRYKTYRWFEKGL
ncbi:MAG: GNAT family N-acetyltransferase, partial [Deltaproteobacteria bacterium]